MDKIYHFSAPGRTEIGGNHTDHQHGCVIAAAVDMETTAEVTLNGTNTIRVDSEGYKPVKIDLNDRKRMLVRLTQFRERTGFFEQCATVI